MVQHPSSTDFVASGSQQGCRPCLHTIRALGGSAHGVEAHRHAPRLCVELPPIATLKCNLRALLLGLNLPWRASLVGT
jgi:hypothetical protein